MEDILQAQSIRQLIKQAPSTHLNTPYSTMSTQQTGLTDAQVSVLGIYLGYIHFLIIIVLTLDPR